MLESRRIQLQKEIEQKRLKKILEAPKLPVQPWFDKLNRHQYIHRSYTGQEIVEHLSDSDMPTLRSDEERNFE